VITTAFYDPAAGESKKSDYKAIVLGTMLNGKYWVRYAWIKQQKTPNDVLKQLYKIDRDFPGCFQGFEKNGFQVLYKELLKNRAEKEGYPIAIQGITTTSNKYLRIESLAGFVEDGAILFQKSATGAYDSDIGVLIEQLEDFPNGAHDDGPDALYYAFNMARDKAMKAAYGSANKKPVKKTRGLRGILQRFRS
jgi:predicted phage terminase large subunit-like protein